MNNKTKTTTATGASKQNTQKAVKEPKLIQRLKIKVGQHEIDTAIPQNSKHCMITDSLKRDHHKEFIGIVTDKESIAFTERTSGRRYKFPLTPLARAALLKFDGGEKVCPFDCILRNPIVRERKMYTCKGAKNKMPRLAGPQGFGATGAMSGQKDKQRRTTRGMDRFFGKRVFKDELAALRRQLSIDVPVADEVSAA